MSDCYRLSTDDDVRQRTKCENEFYHISTCHTLILVSVQRHNYLTSLQYLSEQLPHLSLLYIYMYQLVLITVRTIMYVLIPYNSSSKYRSDHMKEKCQVYDWACVKTTTLWYLRPTWNDCAYCFGLMCLLNITLPLPHRDIPTNVAICVQLS